MEEEKAIKLWEEKIKNAKNKEEIKLIVCEMWHDNRLEDLTFNDFIDNDILLKLKEFGIIFDEEISTYEKIMQENY